MDDEDDDGEGTDDGCMPDKWGYITTQIIDTGEGVDKSLSKSLFTTFAQHKKDQL